MINRQNLDQKKLRHYIIRLPAIGQNTQITEELILFGGDFDALDSDLDFDYVTCNWSLGVKNLYLS